MGRGNAILVTALVVVFLLTRGTRAVPLALCSDPLPASIPTGVIATSGPEMDFLRDVCSESALCMTLFGLDVHGVDIGADVHFARIVQATSTLVTLEQPWTDSVCDRSPDELVRELLRWRLIAERALIPLCGLNEHVHTDIADGTTCVALPGVDRGYSGVHAAHVVLLTALVVVFIALLLLVCKRVDGAASSKRALLLLAAR